MKTIVAATDFSPASVNAVMYAADMACFERTNLTVVHVFTTPVVLVDITGPVYDLGMLYEDVERNMEELVAKVKLHTGERITVNSIIKNGDAIIELEAACSSVNIYALVLGTESRHTLERILFGGVVFTALRKYLWPIIIVPPDARFKNIKRIGLACDLKKVAESIPMREIEEFLSAFKAELHVVFVKDKKSGTFSKADEEESEWLQEILSKVSPHFHYISNEDVEKGIAEFVKKEKIDLLVIIPKTHSLSDSIFHQHHSKKILLEVNIPVIAIHE